MIQTKIYTFPHVAPHMASLSELRRTVFRAWPYLYDASMPSEVDTLSGFAVSRTAALIIAFDGAKAVGASTAVHMIEEDSHITQPFRDAGMDLGRICYFGESMLLDPYRGQGVGVTFFNLREAHARSIPGVNTAMFCAVERPVNHPLKPSGAVALDAFWIKRGYVRTEFCCKMIWKQVDTDGKIENTLRFWSKSLT